VTEPPAPSAAVVVREAERVADRLGVVGPRLAARIGAEAVRELAVVREGLQAIADAAARARSEPTRAVPALAPRALGDQVLVLAHEVVSTGSPQALTEAAAVLAALRRRL
jgi:hypothetical protein